MLLVCCLLLGGVGCASSLGRIAVKTPNHAKTAGQLDKAHHATPRMGGAVIDHRFRVGVPNENVSLSVWIIDPSNEHLHATGDGLWFHIADDAPRQTRPSHATVLILHGYRHFKNDWAYLMWARFLAEHGYRVALTDLRGHGASTGDWCGFGPREAQDLVHVIDELDRRGLLIGKLGVMGGSYGGTTAIHLAAADTRVKAVVTVSAFASMRSAAPAFVKGYLGWFSGLVGVWGWDNIVDAAGKASRFDPDRSDARIAIGRTRAAVLLAHSTADRHVPASDARALDEAGGTTTKLELMDGGGHFKFGVQNARRVRQAALAWFNQHLK